MASIKIKASFAGAPVSPSINVEDEGVLIVSTQDLNFVGTGVTVTENPAGTAEISIPGNPLTVKDEGASIIANPANMNFIGAGVTVTENPAGTAEVSIPGNPLTVKDEGVSIVSNPANINFIGAGVTVTQNPAGTAEVSIPGGSVQFWTESESAATQQNTRWIPNNAATNVVAVISPKGNGANTAQRPDGAATGGNARGNFATDWQKNRTTNTMVASGTESVISGGQNNTASSAHSTVAGGQGNTASAGHATVGGGQNHTASGAHSTVAGGRQGSAQGQYSTVVGGNLNLSSGISSTTGGDQSQATNFGATCFGTESTASGSNSILLGRQSQTTTNNAHAIGFGNRVEGVASFASGGGALIKNARQKAFSQSFNASGSADILLASGRAQEGCVILGFNNRLTGGTLITTGQVFYLSLGNSGLVTPANVGWLPATSNQQFTFQLKLFATITAITGTATGIAVGNVKQWNIQGSGKNVANVITILNATTTPVVLYEDAGLATFSAQFIQVAGRVVVEITAPTFAGGGSLQLMVNGFMYYQEAALD